MEGTPSEQLQKIEQEYRQKRAELEQQMKESAESAESAPAPSEHETMSQVVEGAIREQLPEFEATHPVGHVNEGLSPEARGKIQEWVNVAFTKGPAASIRMAKNSNDPALIDEYHAALTGDLYRMLIEQKKIPEVN